MESEYPLSRTWVLWEMWNQNKNNTSANFQECMQPIGNFENLHSFWQYWNCMAHACPADLFKHPRNRDQPVIQPDNVSIDAVAVFEQGVCPAWEDPVNSGGCDISIRIQFSHDQADKMKESWDLLVFNVIGENFPFNEEIVGCRIVDKLRCCKYELWLRIDNQGENVQKVNSISTEVKRIVFNDISWSDSRINPHN